MASKQPVSHFDEVYTTKKIFWNTIIFSDGRQWAHVICAWLIPGVKFGNPKEMAPIVDIDKIPVNFFTISFHQVYKLKVQLYLFF